MKKLLIAGLLVLFSCNRPKDYWDYMERRDYKGALEYLENQGKWLEALRHSRVYRVGDPREIAERCWEGLDAEGLPEVAERYICGEEVGKGSFTELYRAAEHEPDPVKIFIAIGKLDYFGHEREARELEKLMKERFGELEFGYKGKKRIAIKRMDGERYYWKDGEWLRLD